MLQINNYCVCIQFQIEFHLLLPCALACSTIFKMTNEDDNDDAAQQHAWSISARLAALQMPIEELPEAVAELILEARDLHPEMTPKNQMRSRA